MPTAAASTPRAGDRCFFFEPHRRTQRVREPIRDELHKHFGKFSGLFAQTINEVVFTPVRQIGNFCPGRRPPFVCSRLA